MERRWRYAAGAAAVLAVALFIAAVFSLMTRVLDEPLSLTDSQDGDCGWRYELLTDEGVAPYEPNYDEDGYVSALPEGTLAVRMTRTMAEDIPDALIQWYPRDEGVEIWLDETPLHSDFPSLPREGDGFLRPGRADWAALSREVSDAVRIARLSLPDDYAGSTLTVISYIPEDAEEALPVYPVLGRDETFVAALIVRAVSSSFVMVLYAILALVMAAVFLLDSANDGADGKTLLLSVYFLALFFNEAYFSYYPNRLAALVNPGLLYRLYTIPLCLYMALRVKRRWRIPLCAAIAVTTIYEVVSVLLHIRQGWSADIIGPELLILFLAVTAAFTADAVGRYKRSKAGKRELAIFGGITAAAAAIHLFEKGRVWGGIGAYFSDGILIAMRMGNCEPAVTLFTDVASITVTLIVLSEFIRRTLRTRQEMSALEERGRLTLESYERLLAAENATNAMRHEMRHHMTALAGILKGGDAERAERYVASVVGEMEQLPAGRYSLNLLVNVIASTYLDRAKAEGVRVQHRLNVPAELAIADEDLSMLLSNLLQNALEACEKMRPEDDRFIEMQMSLRGNFLFVKCVNSAPAENPGRDGAPHSREHGYGMAAMRRVAEKYDSVLMVEQRPGEFEVKSNLCLKNG